MGNSKTDLKPIKDFPLYLVNPTGGVWSCVSDRWLKPRDLPWPPYPFVTVRNDGFERNCYVHRLVAETHLPNPEGLPCINHKDGNKKNYRLENLEWCSREANMRHAVHTGLTRIRAEHPGAKLTEKIVSDIRFDYLYRGATQKQLADKYGVWRQNISRIVRGKTWVIYPERRTASVTEFNS